MDVSGHSFKEKDIQTQVCKADLSSSLHFSLPNQRMLQYGTLLYNYCRPLHHVISSMLYSLAQWKWQSCRYLLCERHST